MNRTWRLLRAQMIEFFPINELREPGNTKKNTAVIVGIGGITVVLFLCVYNILTAQTLAQAGEQDLIPAYMIALASFAILFLTMFRSNGLLFGSKDMDMLSSLPVKSSELISSKFLFMYLLNFVVCFVFIVPGAIVWMINTNTDILRFILYLVSILFVPLLPMCIASLVGVSIILISSRFKNRNMFSLIFSFVALGILGYIGISSVQTGTELETIGAMLAKQVTGIYPPSRLFLENTMVSVPVGMSIYLVLSFLFFCFFVKIVAKKYNMFHALASSSSKYKKHSNNKMQSPFIALYHKELGRFFSSNMAVLNSGLGVILLCLFSILLLIMSPQQLGSYAGIEDMNGFLSSYAPIVVAAMLCLSCTTPYSISLEGKHVWTLQSSPVSIRTILNSKVAVNLTLHAFGYLLAVIAITTQLDMTIVQFMSLLWIPICYSFFIVVLGIFLNKKYTNYEWNSEMMVVKQSIPVIVSGILGMVSVAVPVLSNWILQAPMMPILWVTSIVLVIATIIMYQKACKSNYI